MAYRNARSGPPTVLVVENYLDTRVLMKTLLKAKGCRVLEAEDGRRAVELAVLERPGLILMNLCLRFVDGAAATRLIRRCTALRDVPIIGLTHYTGAERLGEALAAGCNEVLSMPFDFDALDHLLVDLLPSG